MDRTGVDATAAGPRAARGALQPTAEGQRDPFEGQRGAQAVPRGVQRLNLTSIGAVLAVLWLLAHVVEARPALPDEALAWRYLRALADHPLRTGLASVLLAGALAGRRALWREP